MLQLIKMGKIYGGQINFGVIKNHMIIETGTNKIMQEY